MLTFQFSGVDGTMTESEILTSGMVGKAVQILFDDSWNNLTKTVVFRAGDTTRVVVNAVSPVTIPAEVLERPFGKLFVGVYGTDEAGALVIPTIMAEGPMIRYGADPIEDETAKELPVWVNLQNQIGHLAALNTGAKTNLVGAVNEVHSQVAQLLANANLSIDAAQLLVDILSKGLYTADLAEKIDALAAELGVSVSEDLGNLLHYWDFRTGSLVDRIGGLEAVTTEDVTLDSAGAHNPGNASYIMLPTGTDGASLAGRTAEIKFGELNLDTAASTMRLAMVCTGSQPANLGLLWSAKDCWTRSATVETEFTELNMFSGKSLRIKSNDDATQQDYYLDDQLITSVNPSFTPTYLSIGSTANGAFPLCVEYVRIYPNT